MWQSLTQPKKGKGSMSNRTYFTAEHKVAIIRRRLLEGVADTGTRLSLDVRAS